MATETVQLTTEQPLVTEQRLCELSVLDETGDTRMQWNPANPAEVTKAEARFNELKSKGYLAYKVTGKGDQGEVMHAFDPAAERIILHSAMIGG